MLRSRAEDGCLHHSVHVDIENPLRLFFYEQWREMVALFAHFEQPGSRAFITGTGANAAASEPVALFEATALPFPH